MNNHPFIDGNKRVGHAATETFLDFERSEIDAPVDDQERLMLDLALLRFGYWFDSAHRFVCRQVKFRKFLVG